MVPVPIAARNSYSSRLLYILFSLATQHAPRLFRRALGDISQGPVNDPMFTFARRDTNDCNSEKSEPNKALAVLIPILVLMSGLFAGLTLGYMSLDETQLNVLSISGTPYVVFLNDIIIYAKSRLTDPTLFQ